jgi:quercetin dioxygenase-like cupin family protein
LGVLEPQVLRPMDEDEDDYRPSSRWALLTDPAGDNAVDDISIIVEDVAPGDRIPLHRHRVNEAVMILAGVAEVTLGDAVLRPDVGSTVFIPAGVVHGHRNVGSEPLRIHAIFPATVVDMEMLERNPAPGTEGAEPKHTVYDMRSGTFQLVEP